MERKRGMTGEKWFLVSVILIILAVAIILFFYGKLHDAFDIKREACRNSVLMRSTFNYNALEVGRKTIPLKCQTEKVCFYKDKKECTELSSRENDRSVRYIQVNNKEEVMKEITDLVYDCHWEFGEGKANFMPTRDQTTDYCLICARFAFDKGIQENVNNYAIQFGDLYQYMSEHYINENAKDKVSFYKYVYGVDNWNTIKTLLASKYSARGSLTKEQEKTLINAGFSKEIKDIDLGKDLGQTQIDLKKHYAIASRFTTQANLASLCSTGAVVGAGALIAVGTVITGGAGLAGLGVVLTLAKSGAVLAAVGGITYYTTFSEGYSYASGIILPYQELTKWNCESIETTS